MLLADHYVVGAGNTNNVTSYVLNIQAGNGNDLIAGGLGQVNVQAGNGNDMLFDGNVAPAVSGDTLAKILSDWENDIAVDHNNVSAFAADVAAIHARLNVTENNTNANTLNAGNGLDWFWERYAKDKTNIRPGDLLN